MAFNILSSLPAAPGIDQDPVTKVRGLVAFWYARWGACERLSDLPIELGRLRSWADSMAIFEPIDRGADFLARTVGGKLIPPLGDWSGSKLSELPSPYRQDLRQILLRASMIREPAAERYDWLVKGRLWSCTACAMPVAGELYQPTRLLLGVFYSAREANPLETANSTHIAHRRALVDATERYRRASVYPERLLAPSR